MDEFINWAKSFGINKVSVNVLRIMKKELSFINGRDFYLFNQS